MNKNDCLQGLYSIFYLPMNLTHSPHRLPRSLLKFALSLARSYNIKCTLFLITCNFLQFYVIYFALFRAGESAVFLSRFSAQF